MADKPRTPLSCSVRASVACRDLSNSLRYPLIAKNVPRARRFSATAASCACAPGAMKSHPCFAQG
jgi:hypothetical protein